MGFDEYASDYDAALERGLAVAGESKDYFARNRIAWLSGNLAALREQPQQIMDYGCGIGSAVPFPDRFLLHGLDRRRRRVREVSGTWRRQVSARATFLSCDEYVPRSAIDLVFCNGVFHHIDPQDRASAVDYVYRSLRPGGVFALWENNPWNPGTRYVMSRIPFDRDTTPVAAPETRRLLSAGGFEILRTDYLFLFPRMLSWLRALEPRLSGLPFGAQYQVLCRRPARHGELPARHRESQTETQVNLCVSVSSVACLKGSRATRVSRDSGARVCPPRARSSRGAPADSFQRSTNCRMTV